MKKIWCALSCLLLVSVMLAGCAEKEEPMDWNAMLERIVQEGSFDTELSEVGSNAVLYFPDLPRGSQIRLYTGSGYFADEAALLTLPGSQDAEQAMQAVEKHLSELRNQFQNYVPAEVGKIDGAVTAASGNQILLCIAKDPEQIRSLMKQPAETMEKSGPEAEQEPAVYETLGPSDAFRTAAQAARQTYPVRKSRSGSVHDYGNGIIRVDDAAYELYTYHSSAAESYADVINAAAEALGEGIRVYDLAVPTGAILVPDDVAGQVPGSDQGQAIRNLFSMLSGQVVGVNPYPNLMQHRDEYLYFRTDYHWNGRGAYYAYEAFCQAKGIRPYPLSERREQKFDGFLGALYYNNSGKDAVLAQNPDTVEAFHPHSPNAKMRYTDAEGKTYDWSIIMDVSDWNDSSKYSTFAAADNPIAVFENPDVTDGSVAVVVKESYGNAMLPYLVDHYSTIYELDYRYWQGKLVDFVREKKADDLIFINNLSMIGSNLLVGKLADIVR